MPGDLILTPVPTADSANNRTTRDVIGTKTDTHNGDSLMAAAHTVDEHFHKSSQVYPTLADGVLVTATANDWTDLGAFAVIVATNGITSDFDIHFVNVETVSAVGHYELVLYSGADAAEVEVARVRFLHGPLLRHHCFFSRFCFAANVIFNSERRGRHAIT